MFFLLSKLLLFIITPMVWIAGLMAFSLFTKNEVRKRKAFIWSLALLLFFSNSFLVDEVMRLWEVPATADEQLEGRTYDAGIVLGGMSSYDSDMKKLQFNQGSDRLMQAVKLYKNGTIRKIIISGGSGSIVHEEVREAPLLKEFLRELSIPAGDVLIESESKNTHENAFHTKQLLDKDSVGTNLLLITSAFHMRRAMGCFKKEGIIAEPYSTDRFAGPRKWVFDHLLIPNSDALETWTMLIHEMVGALVYKVVGYS